MNMLTTTATALLAGSKGVTFASYNLRGLISKTDDISLLLHRSNLDLLCIQESLLTHNHHDDELRVPNYDMYRLDRDTSQGKNSGGGLVTYCHKKYVFEQLHDWSCSTPELEMQWFRLSLPETRPTLIANTYRPPTGNIDTAIEIIKTRMNDIEGNPDIVILGDFNIDVSKKGPHMTKYQNFLKSFLLDQLINAPTRITNTSKTTIDHIITNNSEFYCTSGSTDPGLSDHHLVYTARHRNKIKYDVSYFIGRSYREYDEDLFYDDMCNVDWSPIYIHNDVNAATELFTRMLLNVIDRHAPFKKLKCKANLPKWITGDFLSAVDEKEHRCNIYSRRPTVENAARKRRAIRLVKQMKRVLKKGHIEEALTECQGDPKQTWKVIKSLWPGKSKSTAIKCINDSNDPQVIANMLNTHFTNAGSNIGRHIEPIVRHARTYPSDTDRPQLNEIQMEDIWELLCTLSPAKASGTDGITARLIKACGETILEPLYHIFNMSVAQSKFPNIWKIGKITPLFKAGDSSNPDNYRPISVLPIFSKLLERLIHNQLYNQLTVSNAFRRSRKRTPLTSPLSMFV